MPHRGAVAVVRVTVLLRSDHLEQHTAAMTRARVQGGVDRSVAG